MTVVATDVTTSGNDDGETALDLAQEDEGSGTATITGSDLAEDIEAEGVDVSRN